MPAEVNQLRRTLNPIFIEQCSTLNTIRYKINSVQLSFRLLVRSLMFVFVISVSPNKAFTNLNVESNIVS